MALSPGVRLGSYEITASLGAGGMGEVYRARDTKLNRDVAVKVLPELVAHDSERLARFEREAHLLAALNHPQIAHIYGFEDSTGITALVMELVEGPTLADRIAQGPIPIDETLSIAKQIAEALEAAHEQGIIHRDLKPMNIKLRPDGTVKVLDFGLAKALDSTPISAEISESPTLTSPTVMSRMGVLLGTVAYMSPEQAKGRPADKRSDVWAFGCVLYEMLTGRRAFQGEDMSDTLASVLRSEPDWLALPPAATPLRRTLQRCLEKDLKRRLRDVRDIKLLLEDDADVSRVSSPAPSTAVQSMRAWWMTAVAIGMIGGATAGGLFVQSRSRPAPPRVARFDLTPVGAYPLTTFGRGVNVAISPDGSRIVYSSSHGTENRLIIRQVDRLDARLLTEEGADPFFSPDGEQVGFVTVEELKKVPAGGGPSVTISRLPGVLFSGASWDSSDTIVFAQMGAGGGLFRVSAAGGETKRFAAPDATKGEVNYFRPTVLSDAHVVLYTVGLRGGETRIVARKLQGGDATSVVEGGFDGRYLPSGHLVFGQADRLMAVRFDVNTLRATSSPVPVQEDVHNKVVLNLANVASAADGTMLYVSGGQGAFLDRPVWVDRRGARMAPVIPEPLQGPRYPRLSPDGRRLALTVGPGGQGNIWVYDLSGAAQPLKLTFREHNIFPIWSSDGKRIVFLSRSGSNGLLSIPADGSAMEPDRLTTSENPQIPLDVSLDGSEVLFTENSSVTRGTLWLLNIGDRKTRRVLQSPFAEENARISPNGRWVAYVSDQTGTSEIWVRPFPGPGAPIRISPDGGQDPVWSREGTELFYTNGTKMCSARVVSEAPTFRAAAPSVLFESGYVRSPLRAYDVAPDGRFLMIEYNDTARPPSIVVVLNWFDELKRLVPSK